MDVQYIVVQAGGKGTRLEHLTANKPKALVPVFNLPMLFHLFRKFPDMRFIIIADYKKEVLRKYLSAFAKVQYCVVDASGSGTCGGLPQAMQLLPDKEPFMLIWSDLILPESFTLPEKPQNYIGVSETFPCRWSYDNGEILEKPSTEHGIAGLFIFKDSSCLNKVPQEGEFVRWLQGKECVFSELGMAGTKEFGLLSEYQKLEQVKTRPFNSMSIEGNYVIKESIDAQGEVIARHEKNWYKYARENGVECIPQIFSYSPLKMERIFGKNIYEYTTLNFNEKKAILEKLVASLKELHSVYNEKPDQFSIQEAYFKKTMKRLNQVRDLIPFADCRTITINGRACRNVFYNQELFEQKLNHLPCDNFEFIHGDCTFSNIMLKDDGTPTLIDPRGYFGYTELFGDPNYDWAKLYYSLVGNYDHFNLKEFSLNIDKDGVVLKIASNNWEDMEDYFFELIDVKPNTIRLLHAMIWLSLTTYAWQDYDSICGAFYNGLYYLEEVL